jgi:hypothetical protein
MREIGISIEIEERREVEWVMSIGVRWEPDSHAADPLFSTPPRCKAHPLTHREAHHTLVRPRAITLRTYS